MVDANADFMTAHLTQTVRTAPDTVERGIAALKRMYERGELEPLPGWEGDTLDGYMDLLGLNGRPIRVNRAAGTKT